MNAHGIPVFYGAFSEEVAVAEIRPHVGGLIVVGKFEVIKPLKLLDLSQYRQGAYPGSMFAAGYRYRVTQWKFLRQFLSIICRPIQPSDEALEYVATQAIAEYLASELKFDGIVYPSAQVGGIDSEDDYLGSENDEALLSYGNIAIFEAIGIVQGENPDSNAIASTEQINSTHHGIPDFEELWRMSIQESKNESYIPMPSRTEPALRYIEYSAHIVRMKAIKVSYESFQGQDGDVWY